MVSYGVSQLKGQLKIVYGAEPIQSIKSSNYLDSNIVGKLQYIDEVRRFAMDSLGFSHTKNYTTFYDQNNKPLMWVVTGCLPYEFIEKTWWFPIIGSVSYKGFFNEKSAIEEATNIAKEGYEYDIYNPEAWSTLGYFKDPILSGMLNRGPGKLAELIIHELAHATVYLPGEVELNENLATLAGELGALQFLKFKYGNGSTEVKRYANRLHDDDVYHIHMLNGFNRLDSLYKSMKGISDNRLRARKKYRLISEILLEINRLPLNEKYRYLFDFENKKLPGNPDFMAFSRYRRQQESLKRSLVEKYQNNLGFMLRKIDELGAQALN